MSDPSDRLTKLLLLLSSDRDGEVLNAARAIGRLLASHKKDWHDLANAAGSALASESVESYGTGVSDRAWAEYAARCAAREAERKAHAAAKARWTEKQIRATIEWCLENWKGPEDADWHFLADASQAAKVGYWARVSIQRLEEIRRKIKGEPEPKAKRSRRSSAYDPTDRVGDFYA